MEEEKKGRSFTTHYNNIKVWLKSFIPRNIPNYTMPAPGQHSGKSMIPGPLPTSNCFLTDNRDFDLLINASSRMHSEIKINVTAPIPSEVYQHHRCDETREIDCSTGVDYCVRNGNTNRMQFKNLRGTIASQIQVDLEAAANNPCVNGSPDIDYIGTITINLSLSILRFDGKIEPFPGFEMYTAINDGPGIVIFRESPIPGSNPWDLYGGPNRPVHGEAKI